MASHKPWSIPDLPSTTPMPYNTSSQLLPAQFYGTTHPAKLAGAIAVRSTKEHSMPKTQQDFLEEARREIPEVSVEEVEARRKRGDDFILLDVREKDEVRAGYIDGAVTIPRGFLEFQAAGQIPNTDKDVVVYCAGGRAHSWRPKCCAPWGMIELHRWLAALRAGEIPGMPSCAIAN